MPSQPAILALADGTLFAGESVGADGVAVGEVVFNTAMTGYQEILTDPSYCRQIVTLTYPHIGNTGINAEDVEADRVYAAGLVIRDLPVRASNWRQSEDLPTYLQRQSVTAIAGIDTRKLTRVLRERGAQNGCLMAGRVDPAAAVAKAREFPGLAGMDLARAVTCREPYDWSETEWSLSSGYGHQERLQYHVVAYDYGVKRNILRKLAEPGMQADGVAGAGRCAAGIGVASRRRLPIQWAGRPRALRLRDPRHPTNCSIAASRSSGSVLVISCWRWLLAPAPSR